ncbi:hypothetical protein FB451DRAFT_976753, partial [Mycena latifolia]
SPQKMSGQDRLPVELWVEIFALLPRDAIPPLSLTCSTFRGILIPLLFTHFAFHTWTPVAKGSPSVAEIDRYLERLDFFSSDEIGPLVRSCAISARPRI